MNKGALVECGGSCCNGTAPAAAESRRRRALLVGLTLLSSLLLLASVKLPLWHLRMEAPQYHGDEALRVAVYPSAMRGDLKELSVLDRYIGVHIPTTLPQFNWLPAALIVGAALGLGAGLLRGALRTRALTAVCVALAAALVVAAVQAQFQMHDIGHKRAAKTALVGVKDFTPPFLGTTKIAQFTVSSRFGLGAWLIGGALALQLGAAWLGRPRVFAQAVARKRVESASSTVTQRAPVQTVS